jgi:hypothetical protein
MTWQTYTIRRVKFNPNHKINHHYFTDLTRVSIITVIVPYYNWILVSFFLNGFVYFKLSQANIINSIWYFINHPKSTICSSNIATAHLEMKNARHSIIFTTICPHSKAWHSTWQVLVIICKPCRYKFIY